MPAVLLCGGASRRMGFPKEMLLVDGAPLVVHRTRALQQVFTDVAISSNTPGYIQPWLDVPVFEDEVQNAGPLAGIHAGLKRSEAEAVFFCACDMPLVHNGIIAAILARAGRSDARAVVARENGRVQPLLGVYRRSLLPDVEAVLAEQGRTGVCRMIEGIGAEYVDFGGKDAQALRDINSVADLGVLREVFKDVEPLPVKEVAMTRLGGDPADRDVIAEEWPVAVFANGIRLATILCLPTALRRLAIGFASYLGLVHRLDEVESLAADYEARRVAFKLRVPDERIRNSVQMLVTSTCGANIYGPQLEAMPPPQGETGFRVRRTHIVQTIRDLRSMAPVFGCTGSTHQAAFSDGERIRYFYEDIGRHNAIDKIVGAALIDGADLTRGVLLTTGRLNSEMVVKALRQGIPVLASRSAAGSNALRLAETYGLTVAGFARGRRINIYTTPERVSDE